MLMAANGGNKHLVTMVNPQHYQPVSLLNLTGYNSKQDKTSMLMAAIEATGIW